MRALVMGAAFALVASAAQAQSDEEEELALLFDTASPVLAASKSRTAESAGLVPAHVVVVTAEEIRAFGFRTLSELLHGVAEIDIQGERYWPVASVRGLGRAGDYNQRILVLLDGHVLNDAISDAVGIDSGLPIFASPIIERVEVILGPVSAIYGSNAFYGAVNIVTKRPEDRAYGVLAEGGTFEHGRGVTWYADKGSRWSVLAMATGGRAEGETIYGERNNDWQRNGAGYLRATWGPVTVSAFGMGRRVGMLGNEPATYVYDDGSVYRDEDPLHDRDRWYQRVRGTGVIEWAAYRSDAIAVTARAYANRTDTKTQREFGADYHDTWGYYRVFSEEMGAEAIFEWRRGPSTLVASIDDFYQRNAQSSEFDATDNPDWLSSLDHLELVDNTVRGSVHERLRLGPATIEAGVYAEGSRLHGAEIAPSAAGVVRVSKDTTLKAMYGRGFRRASFYELSTILDDNVRDWIRPETVDSTELQVSTRVAPGMEVTADVFRAEYSRLIVRDDFEYGNAGGTLVSTGATAGITFRDEAGTFTADASYYDTEGPDSLRAIGAPRWIGHADALIRMTERIRLGMRAAVVGPRLDRNREALDTGALVDASLHAELAHGFHSTLSVTNLVGTRVDVPVEGYRTPLHPLRGRWVFLQLAWER